jgi:hypothetical protein
MKIGKRTRNGLYMHKAYAEWIPRYHVARCWVKIHDPDYEFQVVRYNDRTGDISFIQSPDFDTADEPMVIESRTVTGNADIKVWRGSSENPFIYHHKHMFVAADYPGFDVEASKRRSEAWTKLPDVDRNRIGRRKYWQQYISNYELPSHE